MVRHIPEKRPVIIGVGQCVHHPKDLAEIKKPLDLIEVAIHRAENDAGLPDLARKIDTLCLVNILSRSPEGLPSELSHRINAGPQSESYTWVGATAPQWFVNRAAERIFKGQTKLALICGGEAFYSRRVEAKIKGGNAWNWGFPAKMPHMVGDLRDPITPLELKYGLLLPIHFYPLFENALRYHEGMSIEGQRQELGEFCSAFSSIAAKNPYAWFKETKSSDEIVELSSSNRMVSFPYTKSMCSIMEVDQAAALFLTDAQTARELGVPKGKLVYLLGSGDASDIWHVTERVNFYASPSVREAADATMGQAGLSLGEIDYLDFYSCFPCAPRITRNMLGLPKDEPRPLTVTGGMPYFGGPGNNYSLHAICKMVELLRRNPAKIGLVQALSWFLSKHSVGIYSGEPGRNPWKPIPAESCHHQKLSPIQGAPVVEEAAGTAHVETYMLFHDRQGEAIGGVVVGKLDEGARFLAKLPEDKDILNAMMNQEFIGEKGTVHQRGGFNIFEP
ncbi:MAG: acetyl-CoA acetyltransferase [Pseudomonadota bacterium]